MVQISISDKQLGELDKVYGFNLSVLEYFGSEKSVESRSKMLVKLYSSLSYFVFFLKWQDFDKLSAFSKILVSSKFPVILYVLKQQKKTNKFQHFSKC